MKSFTTALQGVANRATNPARRRSANDTFLYGRTRRRDDLLVRSYFAISARVWSQHQGDESHLGPIRAGLAAVPADPARIVDLGCGAGGNCLAAAERWPDAQVVGYDASRRMIRYAGELGAPDRVSFVRSPVADVVDRADLVMVCNFVLYPARVRDLVVPGGHVLVADSFHHREPAMQAQWESFDLQLVAGDNVDGGFYEVYAVA